MVAPTSYNVDDAIVHHYESISNNYHRSWFYIPDGPLELWQINQIKRAFSPEDETKGEDLKIADIGGGTGRFAHLMHKAFQTIKPVTCVDMSSGMLSQGVNNLGIEIRNLDARIFASGLDPESYDRFLLKEMVHHIPKEDHLNLFKDLYNGLKRNGKCLILTRPPVNHEYPFFAKAHEVRKQMPESDNLIAKLREVGFDEIIYKTLTFPAKVKQDDWLRTIQERMWSAFSEAYFSAEELQNGIEEIKRRYKPDENGFLTFKEKTDFILAVKH